jgi:hypothetical protein
MSGCIAMNDHQEIFQKETAETVALAAEAASRQIGLDSYIALVNRCADSRLNQEISNSSPFHARVLIGKLFAVARKKVQILTGSLVDKTEKEVDIYGYQDVIAQAKRFLRDPSSSLTIIVQTGEIDGGNGNRFLHDIISDDSRNGLVELLVASPSALAPNIPHFMVSDAIAYRFEPGSHVQPDSPATAAVANFGDFSGAAELDSYFGKIVGYLNTDTNFEKSAFLSCHGQEVRAGRLNEPSHMSFVSWIAALLYGAWTSSAQLSDFAPLIDVSIALNLAYSILLRLGNFSGKSLEDWILLEKTRVIGPLADDPTFDAARYELGLIRCGVHLKKIIKRSNQICIWWCMIAVLGALIILVLLPFHADLKISGKVALENVLLLVGPVPSGIIVMGIMHSALRTVMLWHTFEGDLVLKYRLRRPTTGVIVSRDTLPAPGTATHSSPREPAWTTKYRKQILIALWIVAAVAFFFKH